MAGAEDDVKMPLLEHLTELRTRLLYSVVGFVIAFVVCFYFWKPVLDVITVGGSAAETHGLQIQIGSSRMIDVDLFSAGSIPNGWTVAVYPYESFYGGTASLAFSLDRSTGGNGDVLHLTITALRTNPSLGVDPFFILSTYGTSGSADFRSHIAMGLVTN